MTRVEYRLAAARFFLKTLVEQRPVPPEFDYVLEALITTARSVGWLMRSEVREEHRYLLEEWQKANPPKGEVAELFKQLNDARVRITKLELANTKQSVKLSFVVPPDQVAEFKRLADFENGGAFTIDGPEEGPVVVRSKDGKHEYKAKVEVTFQSIDEFPNRDILDVAARYLQHLELRYRSWRGYYKLRAGIADPSRTEK